MVMPYKRYSTQAVEEILSGTTSAPVPVACENSTIRRIRIWFFLLRSCTAKPLVIASHSAQRPKLPERFEKTEPVSSRLLDAASKKNKERKAIRHTAISFTSIQGGSEDV